jgi:hypothetical protein
LKVYCFHFNLYWVWLSLWVSAAINTRSLNCLICFCFVFISICRAKPHVRQRKEYVFQKVETKINPYILNTILFFIIHVIAVLLNLFSKSPQVYTYMPGRILYNFYLDFLYYKEHCDFNVTLLQCHYMFWHAIYVLTITVDFILSSIELHVDV